MELSMPLPTLSLGSTTSPFQSSKKRGRPTNESIAAGWGSLTPLLQKEAEISHVVDRIIQAGYVSALSLVLRISTPHGFTDHVVSASFAADPVKAAGESGVVKRQRIAENSHGVKKYLFIKAPIPFALPQGSYDDHEEQSSKMHLVFSDFFKIYFMKYLETYMLMRKKLTDTTHIEVKNVFNIQDFEFGRIDQHGCTEDIVRQVFQNQSLRWVSLYVEEVHSRERQNVLDLICDDVSKVSLSPHIPASPLLNYQTLQSPMSLSSNDLRPSSDAWDPFAPLSPTFGVPDFDNTEPFFTMSEPTLGMGNPTQESPQRPMTDDNSNLSPPYQFSPTHDLAPRAIQPEHPVPPSSPFILPGPVINIPKPSPPEPTSPPPLSSPLISTIGTSPTTEASAPSASRLPQVISGPIDEPPPVATRRRYRGLANMQSRLTMRKQCVGDIEMADVETITIREAQRKRNGKELSNWVMRDAHREMAITTTNLRYQAEMQQRIRLESELAKQKAENSYLKIGQKAAIDEVKNLEGQIQNYRRLFEKMSDCCATVVGKYQENHGVVPEEVMMLSSCVKRTNQHLSAMD